jgi:hypothetical protein
MAAGLGFKDFTTGEVLTAADVDGYLMQGIWVFASNAARDAAVTAPAEGNFAFTKDTNSLWYYDGAAWVASGATGDIEGVTAGVGISGGGTSGTVTVTNSMATAIDAKGDLIGGTGADTFARLAVGTNNQRLVAASGETTGLKYVSDTQNTVVDAAGDLLYGTAADTLGRLAIGTAGQVLKVNAGATAPEWGAATSTSGLNLIATDPFSAVSSITKDSLFSSTYDNYLILIEFNASATCSFNFYFRDGGSNITSGYARQTLGSTGTTVNAARTTGAGEGTVANSCDTGRNYIILDIASPNLTQRKGVISEALCTASTIINERYMNVSDSTAACTGIYLFPNTGTISGKVSYYGYGK